MPAKPDPRRVAVPQEHMAHLDPLVGMTVQSASHFYTAQLLLAASERYASKEWTFRHTHFAVPALFTYHALLDSFLNEYLALVEFSLAGRSGTESERSEIRRIVRLGLNRSKVEAVATCIGISTFSEALLDDLQVIFELRNILYHNEASMSTTTAYPHAADAFIRRSGIPTVNSEWISAISCVEAVRWIDNRVREFIGEFCKATGFELPYPDRPFNEGRDSRPGWESTWGRMAKQIWPENLREPGSEP